MLRIDGVELPADRGAVVQVYVNRPDIAAPARGAERGYVGSIVIVPVDRLRSRARARKRCNATSGFALTPEQANTLSNEDNISVTLVPVTGEASKPAEILRYRRVYIASR